MELIGKKNKYLLWDLPALPLTEQFGVFNINSPTFDQKLVLEKDSGHVHLENILPVENLYNSTEYCYRSGTSFKTNQSLRSFINFIDKVNSKENFGNIADIGGNDLYLSRLLMHRAKETYVIDPVCKDYNGQIVDGVRVVGDFVEKVNLSSLELNLVVCRHTLEHFPNPKSVINQWFEQCSDECLYVLEVPDYDCLVEAMRFDAIFHQHIHYFTLLTLTNIIVECGGEVIQHEYNHQGSCGGVLLLAFRKSRKNEFPKIHVNVDERFEELSKKITIYEQQMNLMGEILQNLPRPIYGYGAGLMLATLAYHLKTDFKMIECILDDDIDKHGVTYQNVPVEVQYSGKSTIPGNASFIITSLENIRPIFQNIQKLNPKRILIPLVS